MHTSTLSQERTSPGCGTFGINRQLQEAWLGRPTRGMTTQGCASNQRKLLQSRRPEGAGAWLGRHWWQPVVRI
eukprot:5820396-Amphidinium_carterae.1